MAVTERLGASPALRRPSPSGDVLPENEKSPLSLQEISEHWQRVFEKKPVELDPYTLRPVVFGEMNGNSQSPQFLRHILHEANDGIKRTPISLSLFSEEDSQGSNARFSFTWERLSLMRHFDITLDDNFLIQSFAIFDAPLHSSKNNGSKQSQETPVAHASGWRVSGLRGFLETRNIQMQKPLVEDIVSIVRP